MHRRSRQVRAVLAAGGVSLLAAGCGLQGANAYVPEAQPGSVERVDSLEGVEVTVGSKNFTEQLILGKMAGIVLKASGAEVNDKTNLAGSNASRQAQVDGAVDMGWEYTGTAWVSYFAEDEPIEGRIPQWEAVRDRDLDENGLVWLEPAPMNNTYAFATPKETAEELGITKMSDLAKLPVEDLTFCVEAEFNNRDDGFRPMMETYGLPIGDKIPEDNVTILDTGVIYDVTDKGDTCNFGEVFTTDGRILALGLTPLEDDKAFLPLYNVAAVFQEGLLKDHPELEEAFGAVSEKLTTETMLELNAKVDVDGENPANVAMDWLVA
ncbi:MAG: glycine betaine ABC transporter substrate-binding protein, partial [Nocardioidaceae bacterium]